MTTFIIWRKIDDALFRPRYLEVTGEAIQEIPKENETQFMVGSSRITSDQVGILQNEFNIETDYNTFVVG